MSGSMSLRVPKQERSRQTTERILAALERMLRSRPFDQITIRELLAEAKTSAGSFYARFPTRDALLPALYDRYDARLAAASAAGRFRVPIPDTLESGAVTVVAAVVSRMRENRWLMKAVALHARQHPEMISFEQRERRQAGHLAARSRFLKFRDEIRHPDPETALEFGFFMVLSSAREKVVFGDAPLASSFEMSDERLVEELTRALLAYLGIHKSEGKSQ